MLEGEEALRLVEELVEGALAQRLVDEGLGGGDATATAVHARGRRRRDGRLLQVVLLLATLVRVVLLVVVGLGDGPRRIRLNQFLVLIWLMLFEVDLADSFHEFGLQAQHMYVLSIFLDLTHAHG